MLRALAFLAAMFTVACVAPAQELQPLPGFEHGVVDSGAPPETHFGGGDFFSQDLGTVLRVRYNSESYGQNGHGNLDLGTFQAVNFADSIAFFDGQVTLNDVQGVGFNLGVGYRWMSIMPYAMASERISGLSLWADGTSTEEGNFFPQVGVSYESLGEMWDLRANGYIPVGDDEQLGDFNPTGDIGFQGNFISQITEAVVDQSFTAAELEIARRLGRERDAWAFAGPYFLTNDIDDTVGYEIGLRGYAYPDLLLQVAVSDDEIFNTNATFSVVWFVGRTRTNFQPTCGVPDRFREPVMRNDYVVLTQGRAVGGIPLTDPDGNNIRVVHVDSMAAAGGDGSFENPFDMLSDVNAGGSQQGDIILAHAESIFTADAPTMLKDDQRLLGEGGGLVHTVVTAEEGTIDIPETAPNARNAARPQIIDAITDAIVLANDNEVANFDFEGGQRAITGAGLTGNGNLHDLEISGTTGNAIDLATMEGDFTITEVSVTGGNAFALSFSDFTSTGSVTLDEFTYDGEATAGGIFFDNFDGTFTASDSTLMNGTMEGVRIVGESDGTFTFQNTVEFTSIDGTAFFIDGGATDDDFTGTVTVAGAIVNDTGRSVQVTGMNGTDEPSITFSGNITDTGQGIFISDNAGGTLIFSGTLLDLDPTTFAAITLLNNDDDADINFTARIDIDSGALAGFDATGGGTLTVSNTGNTVNTTTGRPIRITGMNISTLGVNFSEVGRSMATNFEAILLDDNTGGPIVLGTVGDTAGESGTIVGGVVADAIVINNSANVTVSGLLIDNPAAAVSGVRVSKTTTGTQTVNLNDLEINDGDIGIEVTGGAGAGALNMTVNDTAVNAPTDTGISFNNVDAGTIQVNDTVIDGAATALTTDRGVLLTGSNASFTFNSGTVIRETGVADFEIDGGAGTVSFAGDIINSPTENALDTAGRSVHIHDVTGGSVTFTAASSINDENQGMLVEDNTGGTITFLGNNDFDTGAADAVTITNNTGATISLSDLDINTTGGRGFVATGGGTLTVIGSTNTVDTTVGTAVQIEDMTIGAAGVSFQSVNVTNGATNAIFLEDLTGPGQVSIGNAGGAVDSGGTLTTMGNAIVIRNVQNADVRNVRIANAGDDGLLIEHTAIATTAMDITLDGLNIDVAGNDGVDVLADNDDNDFRLRLRDGDLEENVLMDVTGGGAFFLLVEDTDIDVTGATDAFALTFSDGARNGDVTFRDMNDFAADAGRALFIDSTGSASKTIDLLIEDSTFFSATNAVAAADIRSRTNTTMNATIIGNMFDAPGAANDFDMRTDTATGRIRLKLGDEDAADMNTAGGGGGTFIVRELAGDFDIFEVNETVTLDSRNQGAVNTDPNDAAFDNLPVAPPLPTLP